MKSIKMATLWDALDLQQLNKTPLGGLAYNICGNKICQKVLARATWRSLSGEAVIIIIMKSIIQMEKFLMKIPDGKAENSEHVPQSMSKEKVADLDAVKACNSPPHKGV